MARLSRLVSVAGLALALMGAPAWAACNVALSPADIERAASIAIGSEYGDGGGGINKWRDEITVGLSGDWSKQDRDTLEHVIAELSLLIAPTRIRLVESDPEMLVQFAPVDDFPKLNPNYVPVNYGFFWLMFDRSGLYDAQVLISTTGLTRAETDHIIREEITQSLGMANDLNDQSDSIFYGPWTDIQDYSASDTRVIRALYCADVAHGMLPADFRRVLATEAAPPTPSQIEALQRVLIARGHEIARADGVVGDDTSAAIATEQQALGFYADGVPNLGLMVRLKAKS
ncbi:DUF2927 domain-containing protein [Devosia sp. SL43]|uniref:DUF2927 domain-containing protein n=1 Tax=Devosia sp. SL43 TaxID=2806348 RepID=UPI001F36096C|nr:DUF2927 domain-containing protein [Devosia sp. SL43]UJW84496.1 DUF2927 domain-containing protein [Devosia sp. SL43]